MILEDVKSRPIVCDHCQSPNIKLEKNAVIYGKDYGNWPLVWYCYHCDAAVGCHKNTDIPLGKMAGKKIRMARAKAHQVFDPIWKQKNAKYTRKEAYSWLAKQLGIAVQDCHIAWFDATMCDKVIQICNNRPS